MLCSDLGLDIVIDLRSTDTLTQHNIENNLQHDPELSAYDLHIHHTCLLQMSPLSFDFSPHSSCTIYVSHSLAHSLAPLPEEPFLARGN